MMNLILGFCRAQTSAQGLLLTAIILQCPVLHILWV